MDNLKVKLYVTLDTLLESSDYNYAISKNSTIKNDLFIDAVSKISNEFPNILNVVFLIKNDKCVHKCIEYIKYNIENFKYEIETYHDVNDFIKSQKTINKLLSLIDIDDDLLYQWEKNSGKSIKYISRFNHKSSWDCLTLDSCYSSSDVYYDKFINYLHLYH